MRDHASEGGAEALDRTEDLARAWLFVGDARASVISSVTADLGCSGFMRDAVAHLERIGVPAGTRSIVIQVVGSTGLLGTPLRLG